MISPRSIQSYLADHGFYTGTVDGKLGPKTQLAIGNALAEAGVNTKGWTPERDLIGIAQLIMVEGGVPKAEVGAIDGYSGPMFQHAFEHWQDLQRIAPMWAPEVNTSKKWPMQKDVESFFGKPGENLVYVKLPYTLRVAWAPTQLINKVQANKLVAESLVTVLEHVRSAYGEAERTHLGLDIYSGGFNIRPMKSSSKLSMHAYGIAFDFDDQHNQFRANHAQARFAQPEYAAWWEAWETEGWISLGRERDFDWMHIQAARLS